MTDGRTPLPEWLRNPEPPRMTVGRRVSAWVDGRPRLRAARRAWWARRSRTRWSERHPVPAAIISFVTVAATASVLVAGTLYLFFLIKEGQR
ncbi:hypothetical protein [Micromonospora echinofusca]|uniref:K+-transporting ATPase, KdpF subunit n=1 Tax=Micromonospora echinofusca TaxID=47858 RepID=A0ABS3VTR7_MICEH|nr:hypothetical protein [Micromonospora echinofusca]MBO4207908.1 hypothetical protein [Micromonospora echinofusca]